MWFPRALDQLSLLVNSRDPSSTMRYGSDCPSSSTSPKPSRGPAQQCSCQCLRCGAHHTVGAVADCHTAAAPPGEAGGHTDGTDLAIPLPGLRRPPPAGRAASVRLGMSTVAFHGCKINAPFLRPDPRRYPTAESGGSSVIQSMLFCHSALYLFPSTAITDYHKLGVLQLKMLPSQF